MLRITGSVAVLASLALLGGCSDDDGAGASGAGGAGGAAEPGPLVVETDAGAVEGQVIGESRVFLGIPYAAPPIGDLRWRRPQPHEPWAATLAATSRRPSCAQASPLSGEFDDNTSEDCLTLNVWTPADSAASPRPVMVWIHGGGFVLGSGADGAYDGQKLSEATGAVVVTINYRMGPLGFLSLSALADEDTDHGSTGTYGLEDQRAALQWVKDNVAAFDGDPARVTLFGESAGGISTCLHLVSPPSEGLFQRVIIESGPCDTAVAKPTALAQGDALALAAGCEPGPELATCLRGKSTAEIMNALPGGTDFLFGDGPSWFPIEDGYNVPGSPTELIEAGAFADVPTIVGSNANEGTVFFALGGDATEVPDEAAFEALVEQLVPGHGADVLAHYPTSEYGTAQKAAVAAVGDAGFVCPARRTARAIEGAGGRAFLYHFTYAPKNTLFADLGAFHSAETRYVFSNPSQLALSPLAEEELDVAATIMGYWGRHAAAGDPNGDGAFNWPAYGASDENVVLDVGASGQTGLKRDLCDFWDSVTLEL